jgi:hypothetical protein
MVVGLITTGLTLEGNYGEWVGRWANIFFFQISEKKVYSKKLDWSSFSEPV